MAIPKNVPRATVELDRPRTITLQLDSLQRLTQTLGVPLDGLKIDSDELTMNLDAWIWAGLIDEDRDISQAEVRGMIHLGNLPSLAEAVMQVAASSMPKGAEGNGGAPVPPKVRRATAAR